MCDHENFRADVSVQRITNNDGFVVSWLADLRVNCQDCGQAFRFLGLPMGLDFAGAAMSPDGLEARLGLVPQGTPPMIVDRIDTGRIH